MTSKNPGLRLAWRSFLFFSFSFSLSSTAFANTPTRDECERKISQAICVTRSGTNTINYSGGRAPCELNDQEAASFLPALMAIYDEMPGVAQPLFCHLQKIYISDSITSTAFAGYVVDSRNQISAGYIGMRKATLTRQPNGSALATWKEQMMFGGSSDFLSNDPHKTQIIYDLKLRHLAQDGLFYVVLHELGHIADFFNGISSQQACGRACLPQTSRWNDLSWNWHRPLQEAAFYLQDKLCFYGCGRFIPDSEAPALYKSLRDSSFITTYSGVNPAEDFAEFWAWHLLHEAKGSELRVQLPGGEIVDLTPSFTQNGRIAAKMKFIQALTQNPAFKLY